MRRMIALVVMLALFVLPSAVWAQEGEDSSALGGQPSQEEAQRAMQMVQEAMMPMMGQMMSVMLLSMAKTLSEKEVAENLATFSRNYYQALIARGFSEDEAIKIVTATGIPSAGSKS